MEESTVFIVDDESGMREALLELLQLSGLKAQAFATAQEFLSTYKPGSPGCLVTDIRMPGMSGADLQAHLAAKQDPLPVIVISGFADVSTAVRIMKAGARDVIEKTAAPTDLVDAIKKALAQDLANRADIDKKSAFHVRVDSLTPREREVLMLMITGKASRIIASDLGISVNTVEIHRGRVMKKMAADSAVELVRMCMDVGFGTEKET